MAALRWLGAYRGRLNRAGFLQHLFAVGALSFVITGLLLAFVWLWPDRIDLLALNWIATLTIAPFYGSGLVRRLHDLGFSGRWAAAFAAVLPLSLLSDVRPFGFSEPVATGLDMIVAIPVAVGFFVLLLRKGEPEANRFGPAP